MSLLIFQRTLCPVTNIIYADDIFEDCVQLLQKARFELRSELNQDVLERVLNQLKTQELPTYR